ncbi:MAG: hypothetical protein BWY50_02124 [Spirochaetes bacterium ADurb.Bin315]|nr:MAG: hypothetical protein BWY50_02124 [Spirochaetes bacterium ADurb.Bin315]
MGMTTDDQIDSIDSSGNFDISLVPQVGEHDDDIRFLSNFGNQCSEGLLGASDFHLEGFEIVVGDQPDHRDLHLSPSEDLILLDRGEFLELFGGRNRVQVEVRRKDGEFGGLENRQEPGEPVVELVVSQRHRIEAKHVQKQYVGRSPPSVEGEAIIIDLFKGQVLTAAAGEKVSGVEGKNIFSATTKIIDDRFPTSRSAELATRIFVAAAKQIRVSVIHMDDRERTILGAQQPDGYDQNKDNDKNTFFIHGLSVPRPPPPSLPL